MMPYHVAQSEITHSILRTNLRKLIKNPSQYLKTQEIRDFGILLADFDLATGKAKDNGSWYTTPFPVSELHKIIDRNEPWRDYELPKEPDMAAFCGALEISSLFEIYLHWKKDDKLKRLEDYTQWSTRR